MGFRRTEDSMSRICCRSGHVMLRMGFNSVTVGLSQRSCTSKLTPEFSVCVKLKAHSYCYAADFTIRCDTKLSQLENRIGLYQ